MAKVFVSHASEDLGFAEEVRGWLVDDGHEVFLDRDLRDGIGVGEDWEQRLYERLRWADSVVCVVTAAYVASQWCTAEVAIARTRGSRLLPVRAESAVTHPLLKSFQYADATQDESAARVRLTEALRRVDHAGGLGWSDERSPFPGLRPFETDERMVFFGRGDEVSRLAASLRSPAERGDASVLLVVGPSGCGKSSLMRAGLIPAMAAESDWWTVPAFVPGADPVAALARALAEAALPAGLDWTVGEVRRRLAEEGFRALADELLVATRCRRLLVVVDQFEELLRQSPPAERAKFAELQRAALLAGSVHVVATLRPEFLDEVLLSPELAVLPTRTHTLRPLRRESLRAVIEGPADLAGIAVDADLVDRLITDTDSGEALPLLAYALAELADGVTRGGSLLVSRYEQIGGVQGALTKQADAALAEAVRTGGRTQEQVIADLLRLVTVDEQGRPTRWRVRKDELLEDTARELDAFVARRLLTTDAEDGHVVIGVAHEAFLSAWPPLADAIRAASTALRTGRGVEMAADDWVERNRPPERLWEGDQLAAALADTGVRFQKPRKRTNTASANVRGPTRRAWPSWLRRERVLITDRVSLGRTASEFLQASVRRDRRRRRRATTILSFLLVIALVAAGFAFGQRQTAQRQRQAAQEQQRVAQEQQRLATARLLVTQAESVRDRDPRTALRLGLAAHKIHPDRDTEFGLIDTLTVTHYAGTLEGHAADVTSVAFTSDGRTLATAGDDGKVLLWNLDDRTAPSRIGPPLTGHSSRVSSVAFASDGLTLATAGDDEDRTVLLWDLADRDAPRRIGPPLTGSSDGVSSVAFSPDGLILAVGGIRRVRLWNLADRDAPRRIGPPLTGHSSWVGSVAFAPDGLTLASGGDDGTVLLWDVTNRNAPARIGPPLAGDSSWVSSVAFAPDGQTLAAGTGGIEEEVGTAQLWNLADREEPRRIGPPLTGHHQGVISMAFAPLGLILATTDFDGSVLLWDLTDRAEPRLLDEPLAGHATSLISATFAPGGQTLAIGGDDGTVQLWDLAGRTTPRRIGQLQAETPLPISVSFAPDGETLATVGGREEGTVLLWNLADPARSRPIGPPLIKEVGSVAFAQNWRIVATGSADGTVQLWSLANRAEALRLGKPVASPTDRRWLTLAALARDGQTLATAAMGDEDVEERTMLLLWDLTNPAKPRPLGELLTGHSSDASTLAAFAPDGLTLATANEEDETVLLWDLADPAHPRPLGKPLTGHSDSGWTRSMAFAPDGRTLATADGSGNGAVQLWDLVDRETPRQLGEPLTGRSGGVTSVAFAPDGRALAVAGGDGSVQLWDLTERSAPRPLGQPLTGHTSRGELSEMEFAADGQTLATAGMTVLLWDIGELFDLRDNMLARACARAERGFNREEWGRSVPNLDYQDSCAA